VIYLLIGGLVFDIFKLDCIVVLIFLLKLMSITLKIHLKSGFKFIKKGTREMKPYAWVSLPENEIQILPFPDDGKTLVAGDGFYLYTHPVKEECQHHIVDARNEFIESGYICIHCYELFRGTNITHPVKELKQIKGVNYYVDAPTVKELTDELFDKIFADGKRLGVLETEDRFNRFLQTKPLSDEEIIEIVNEWGKKEFAEDYSEPEKQDYKHMFNLIRLVEAKVRGEK